MTTLYVDRRTKKIWKETNKMSMKELVHFIEYDMENGLVVTDSVVQVLKKRLGMKYKVPNANTRKEFEEFGFFADSYSAKDKQLFKVSDLK